MVLLVHEARGSLSIRLEKRKFCKFKIGCMASLGGLFCCMSMLVFVSVVFLFTRLLVLVRGSVLKGFNYRVGAYKTSSYECRFTDMNLSVNFYTIQFFFIRISFILFDLEILLVLPVLYLKYTGGSAIIGVFVIFLVFILVGTLYEIYGGFLSF